MLDHRPEESRRDASCSATKENAGWLSHCPICFTSVAIGCFTAVLMAASTGVYKSMSIGVNKLIGVFSVRIDTIKAYRASFDQWLPLASRHQPLTG